MLSPLTSSLSPLTSSLSPLTSSLSSLTTLLFLLSSPPALGSPTLPEQTGLVILGGESPGSTSAEVWVPGSSTSCSLPDLPSPGYWSPTLNTVREQVVACEGTSCSRLTDYGWEMAGRPLHSRRGHTSAATARGLLLVGGTDAPRSTEVKPANASQGVESFALKRKMENMCSIQVSESVMVLTGGDGTYTLVTEYSGIAGGAPTTRELPELNTRRAGHACGSYLVLGQSLMLIVAGGYDTSSTELLDYTATTSTSSAFTTTSAPGRWREAAALPGRHSLPAGASVAGVFHLAGGYGEEGAVAEVLSWDAVSESWSVAGAMARPRAGHAMAEVPMALIQHYCQDTH